MAAFSSFVDLLTEIEDPRRAEGKLYRLPHVVLFAILAIVAGANSYRTIHSFIDVHLARLRDPFGVKWRKAPAYTTIRGILRQLDPASVEAAFRRHAAVLNDAMNGAGQRHVAIDGKTLRRSFDNFLDRRAAHILSPEFSYRRRVEHGVGSEQARYGENGRAEDVCGEGWVAHEQHRQSGSVVGMYVDCAVSGSCQVAACRNRT